MTCYDAVHGHHIILPGARSLWHKGMLFTTHPDDVWIIPEQLSFDLGDLNARGQVRKELRR